MLLLYPSYLASGDQECHKSDRSICNKNPECGQRLSLLGVLLLDKYLANNCFADTVSIMIMHDVDPLL